MPAAPSSNINIPYSPFLDALTGRPNQEWLLWLMNPHVYAMTISAGLGVTSGGTGVTTIPTNGQLLIGNGSGYTLNTLTAGAGISVTNAAGSITIDNTGVLSFSADTTGLTPAVATTGAVTLGGALNAAHGGTGLTSYSVGDLLVASGATTLTQLSDVAVGNVLLSGGVGVVPNYGKVDLTVHVTGVLPAANGGTGLASYTVGDLIYASGATTLSALSDVAVGNALISGGVGVAPSWGKIGLTTHVSGVLPEANGGTNQSTYAKGDLLYASAANTLSKLSAPAAASYLTINGSAVPAWKHPAVGAFYDTTNQSAAANTPTAITLNGTYISDNISIGSPTSHVVITNANTYSITFSLQLTNPDAASDRVYCWLRVNGTNVANSNSAVDVPGKHAGIDGTSVLVVNFFYTFAANDYFELVWMTVGGTTSITTIPASLAPAYPAAPGVILTVSDNITV